MKNKTLANIPIINIIFKIANAYSYKGDLEYLNKVAPFKFWFCRLYKGVSFAIILGTLLFELNYNGFNENTYSASDAILSIFPNLLGFGIGVFALLFSLPNTYVLTIVKKSNEKNKSPTTRMLASDFAFPLVVYSAIIFISTILQYTPSSWESTQWLSNVLLIYGFVMTFELIGTLFTTVTHMIVNQEKMVTKELDEATDK